MLKQKMDKKDTTKLSKRITIRATEELHRAVKAKTARQGSSLQTVITELLRQWLKEEEE